MQKFLLALIFTIAGTAMFAQKIEDIQELMSKQQWDKAKEGIDKFLSNEKNSKKEDGWYYKAHIYNTIAKDEKLKSTLPNGRMEAFEAYKKYLELDPKAIRGTLEQHVLLFDIYNGFFDAGATGFNEKAYDKAAEYFIKALTIEEFISEKGYAYNNFTFPAFDTSLIQNIALSYYQAKKNDEAAQWYQRLADKKIGGKDYLEVYQFLVEHYAKKKDMANRDKYLQIGRDLYPDNDYWCSVLLDDVNQDDKKQLFAKYEELLNGKCGERYTMWFNYAVEMYNYNYVGDTKPAEYKTLQPKIESALKKAIEINPSSPEANMLMSRQYYQMIYDLQDEQRAIKGTKPEDIKKKNDLKTQMVAKADLLIPYAQKSYDNYDNKSDLRPVEKGNFKIIAGILADAYELKGDKTKSDTYNKKKESIQ